MRNTRIFTAAVAAFALLLSGCKDQPEQIPAYLHIEPFEFSPQSEKQLHKITEAWVYVNGSEFIGAYSLPATFPVLLEGETELLIFPGVKQNGIVLSPNIYPFLDSYSKTVTVTPGQTTNVTPVTSYDADAVGIYGDRGSFDPGASGTISLENRDSDNERNFQITTDGAFKGSCLYMPIDTTHPLMEVATEARPMPYEGASEVWLEMHYNNDAPFQLWLIGENDGGGNPQNQAVYQFNVTDSWNKIYINLTEFLIQSRRQNYRLFFRATMPRDVNNGQYSQLQGNVRIDNIRVVHF